MVRGAEHLWKREIVVNNVQAWCETTGRGGWTGGTFSSGPAREASRRLSQLRSNTGPEEMWGRSLFLLAWTSNTQLICSWPLQAKKVSETGCYEWGEIHVNPEFIFCVISWLFGFSLNTLLRKIQRMEWSSRHEIPHNLPGLSQIPTPSNVRNIRKVLAHSFLWDFCPNNGMKAHSDIAWPWNSQHTATEQG